MDSHRENQLEQEEVEELGDCYSLRKVGREGRTEVLEADRAEWCPTAYWLWELQTKPVAALRVLEEVKGCAGILSCDCWGSEIQWVLSDAAEDTLTSPSFPAYYCGKFS